MAFIEFRNVQKSFGDKVVYRGLNLEVFENESLTIIGGSGQGKSVMLKMLIGLLSVDGGSIFFDGKEITNLPDAEMAPVRRRVSMLFQASALFDSLSVYENVAYGLRTQFKMPESEISDRVQDALERVGMPGIEGMSPSDLSGGMKKRVALARAVAIRPDVLLYDEPTTGLDPVNIARINELILNMKNTLNVTSVVVTHDMSSAFTVSDRVVMIHAGDVVFSGDLNELKSTDNQRVKDFIEGNAPMNEDTAALLRSAG